MIRPPPKSTLFPYPTPFRPGHALADQQVRHRPREVQALAHRAGGGQQLVRVQVELLSTTRAVRKRLDLDRKSTRLNSSHTVISYAVFCLQKEKKYRDAKCTS